MQGHVTLRPRRLFALAMRPAVGALHAVIGRPVGIRVTLFGTCVVFLLDVHARAAHGAPLVGERLSARRPILAERLQVMDEMMQLLERRHDRRTRAQTTRVPPVQRRGTRPERRWDTGRRHRRRRRRRRRRRQDWGRAIALSRDTKAESLAATGVLSRRRGFFFSP